MRVPFFFARNLKGAEIDKELKRDYNKNIMNCKQVVISKDRLKEMDVKQLNALSEEIRREIIENAYDNGGHLASNLGVVELTVALHYVFDIPADKIIFDVGHQCYTHKILTGRGEKFSTLRTEGGLSGFPCREESEADPFSTGHAGTAVAAGLGYCSARDKLGEKYKVISVVGDGALVNGLSVEALISANEKPKNFIVVLNDNGMSISKNTSGLYRMLTRMTTGSGYEKFKRGVKKVFGNSFVTKGMVAFRDYVKRNLNRHNYLDYIGFKYVGVVDGHDMKELVSTLRRLKDTEKPILLHVNTTKGKGYKSAEEQAERFHGVSKKFEDSVNAYSSAFGEALTALADKDDKVFAVTAGMKDGTGLAGFEKAHKESFLDVGICEEYAVTLAGGLAAAGLKPVVAVYSTFLQRAYDEILHDVALQNLNVTFCLDRAGAVGADGVTHQGLYDLSYLSSMPNMTVLAPRSTEELKRMLAYAAEKPSPVAIRYPNGEEECSLPSDGGVETWEKLTPDGDVTVLAVGPRMVNAALRAAEKRKKVCVVNARCVCPLDVAMLESVARRPVITMEENVLRGGFGSGVLEYFARRGGKFRVKNLAFEVGVVKQASVKRQLEQAGLTTEKLLRTIEEIL